MQHFIKYIGIFIILFSSSAGVYSQTKQLTTESEAVLFTCEPGPELYASFGHSALWIYDRSQNIDRLYNFGTFDFDTPGFYPKFIRGKLDYMLSAYPIKYFLAEYKHRKITADGQILNLKLEEKQKLFDLLEENYKPENKFYKYDFFMDNCATRLRDIVVACTERPVNFHRSDEQLSFRKMLFPYLEHEPWIRFGINIILGYSSDKIATTDEYQYLPEQMMHSFRLATIGDEKLVSKEMNYVNFPRERSFPWYLSPLPMFSLLLILMVLLSLFELKKGIHFYALSSTLFIIAGIAGLFLFFMWVGTDHSATNYNMNILWMLPHYLWLGITIKRNSTLRKKWLKYSAILALIMAITMPLWPQHCEWSFTIISLIFAIRLFVAFKKPISQKTKPLT